LDKGRPAAARGRAAPTLARVARDAEDAGFARLSVMDHFWQIGVRGCVQPVRRRRPAAQAGRLREHCARLGRDYDTIEKTAITPFELGKDGSGADKMLARLREMHELGITLATGSLRGPDGPELVAAYGEHIIPVISAW